MKIENNLYSLLGLYKKSPDSLRRLVGMLYNQIPMKYRFGKHYQFFVDLLNDSKKMSSHELNSFQLKQLTKQIEICKNSVPFYKDIDRKSTRLNSSHVAISYAVFCLKNKKKKIKKKVEKKYQRY